MAADLHIMQIRYFIERSGGIGYNIDVLTTYLGVVGNLNKSCSAIIISERSFTRYIDGRYIINLITERLASSEMR